MAFKRHVADARPILADHIHELATGDVWLGYNALEIGLVDRLISSDKYIGERLSDGAQVLKLVQINKPKYPFGRPTTGDAIFERALPVFSHLRKSGLLQDVLLDFQVLFQKSVRLIGEFLAEEGNSWQNVLSASSGPTVVQTDTHLS